MLLAGVLFYLLAFFVALPVIVLRPAKFALSVTVGSILTMVCQEEEGPVVVVIADRKLHGVCPVLAIAAEVTTYTMKTPLASLIIICTLLLSCWSGEFHLLDRPSCPSTKLVEQVSGLGGKAVPPFHQDYRILLRSISHRTCTDDQSFYSLVLPLGTVSP